MATPDFPVFPHTASGPGRAEMIGGPLNGQIANIRDRYLKAWKTDGAIGEYELQSADGVQFYQWREQR